MGQPVCPVPETGDWYEAYTLDSFSLIEIFCKAKMNKKCFALSMSGYRRRRNPTR